MLCRLKPARSIGRTSARRLCTARLPERVDAVVIGGGCVGSSVAYHLQQRGLQTLLLEAHALTAGTTWHTAGMLWRLRPSYVDRWTGQSETKRRNYAVAQPSASSHRQ